VPKLLCVCFILLFSACQRDALQPEKRTLRLNFASEPTALDHRKINYSNAANVLPMLYDGLMRFDSEGNLVPSVAKSVEVSPNGKRYIFHLRRTSWSNGDAVTAYDFEYAWKWVLDPKNPAPLANHLYCLKNGKKAKEGRAPLSSVGVYARDSNTLVVELENPVPYFLELTSVYNFYPMNHLHTAGEDEVIGNGPFVLKEWQRQRVMTLEKNRAYWDKDAVQIERIIITFVQDANTELQLFKKGKLDWAGAPISPGLPFSALPKLKSLNNHPYLGTYYYSLNTKRAPFNHPKIRKALSHAINREEIVEHITQGGESPAYRFVPPGANLTTSNMKITQSDARALFDEGLRELGLTRNQLKPIVLTYNKNELHNALAQAVQHSWKKVLGLNIQLKHRDWKAHLSEIHVGNFDVARLTWKGLTSDPIHFLEIFQNPLHPMHRTGWVNQRYHHLIERAKRSSEPNERLFYLAAAEEILTAEMPIIPIFHLTICFVQNPLLKGYVINQLGGIDYKWAYLDDDTISH